METSEIAFQRMSLARIPEFRPWRKLAGQTQGVYTQSITSSTQITHGPSQYPGQCLNSQEAPQNVRSDENAARRHPSQTRFQTPGPLEQEPIDSTLLQQEYWDDEDSDPEIYHYIVPAGLKVTFQDQAGNMIARVGKRGQVENASRSSTHIRGSSPTPRELQQGHFRMNSKGQYDQQYDMSRGGDVFEMNGGRKGRQTSPWRSHPSTMSSRSTKTIMIDEKGNQMLVKSPSIHRDGGRRLEQPYADISYHARISNI
ncbi:hypothetical protein HYPSUDRAFT_249786 [Hypholoma sublateritium FD-334 SS-4]|uniref:Uncharacterized protein n=1 Tax=Hypholoma sublateritium (strain FD-334 SS-4) TaxID=945553 RepID=A0A0D2LPC7_HYPSF|nr:hypothetical protein HYPSUDRAFT_249786 [Hypholoma sublateritium FD-334 SS-4]